MYSWAFFGSLSCSVIPTVDWRHPGILVKTGSIFRKPQSWGGISSVDLPSILYPTQTGISGEFVEHV